MFLFFFRGAIPVRACVCVCGWVGGGGLARDLARGLEEQGEGDEAEQAGAERGGGARHLRGGEQRVLAPLLLDDAVLDDLRALAEGVVLAVIEGRGIAAGGRVHTTHDEFVVVQDGGHETCAYAILGDGLANVANRTDRRMKFKAEFALGAVLVRVGNTIDGVDGIGGGYGGGGRGLGVGMIRSASGWLGDSGGGGGCGAGG